HRPQALRLDQDRRRDPRTPRQLSEQNSRLRRLAVVEALKAAKVDEAFAAVLDAASNAVMDAAEDPYDFDDRLDADNLSGAASDVRRIFRWI
ncbi:hypothetical protein ACFY04_41860, partial [Streptomyces sp. NPDC001549]|uniref:hypothetical protein n=1 Tax=Streptomyces sp. NPDC001549 TaxID=3364586 RepID=UPI0036AA7FF2